MKRRKRGLEWLRNSANSLLYVFFFSEGFSLDRGQITVDLYVCSSRGQTERLQSCTSTKWVRVCAQNKGLYMVVNLARKTFWSLLAPVKFTGLHVHFPLLTIVLVIRTFSAERHGKSRFLDAWHLTLLSRQKCKEYNKIDSLNVTDSVKGLSTEQQYLAHSKLECKRI